MNLHRISTQQFNLHIKLIAIEQICVEKYTYILYNVYDAWYIVIMFRWRNNKIIYNCKFRSITRLNVYLFELDFLFTVIDCCVF